MIFRTDLAVERRDIYNKANKLENDVDGIECEEENDKNCTITRVKVTNENGKNAINKPIGEYITLDIDKVKYMEEENINDFSDLLSKEISNLLERHIGKDAPVLVVGLGNMYVTPDSLRTKGCKTN